MHIRWINNPFQHSSPAYLSLLQFLFANIFQGSFQEVHGVAFNGCKLVASDSKVRLKAFRRKKEYPGYQMTAG